MAAHFLRSMSKVLDLVRKAGYFVQGILLAPGISYSSACLRQVQPGLCPVLQRGQQHREGSCWQELQQPHAVFSSSHGWERAEQIKAWL